MRLGPPSTSEQEDVRKVLNQLRRIDGEFRRSVRKYTSEAGDLPAPDDVEYWEGFRVAAEWRAELLEERSRLTDEFIELIFQDDDRWLDLSAMSPK
jgi:hypothetical protein